MRGKRIDTLGGAVCRHEQGSSDDVEKFEIMALPSRLRKVEAWYEGLWGG